MMEQLKDVTLPVDDVIPWIAEAIQEWKNGLSEKVIKDRVKKSLDKSADDTLMSLLGLEQDIHSRDKPWRVDHCNGRAGESAAGDYLRKHQKEAIEEWFKQVKLPSISEAELVKIQESVKSDYLVNFRQHLRKKLLAKAEADAQALIDSVAKATKTDSYKNLLKLLGAPLSQQENP